MVVMFSSMWFHRVLSVVAGALLCACLDVKSSCLILVYLVVAYVLWVVGRVLLCNLYTALSVLSTLLGCCGRLL